MAARSLKVLCASGEGCRGRVRSVEFAAAAALHAARDDPSVVASPGLVSLDPLLAKVDPQRSPPGSAQIKSRVPLPRVTLGAPFVISVLARMWHDPYQMIRSVAVPNIRSSVRGSSARPCQVAVGSRRGVARLALMRAFSWLVL